jgi:hypothetical protein
MLSAVYCIVETMSVSTPASQINITALSLGHFLPMPNIFNNNRSSPEPV